MKKFLCALLPVCSFFIAISLADDQLTWKWTTSSPQPQCLLVSLSGNTIGTGRVDWGDSGVELFHLTTGFEVSPICHTYSTNNEWTVQLTISGQLSYLDLTGQDLTQFSGGIATGLVYLGLANNDLRTTLSTNSFSGLESLQYLVISNNGLTIEQYNALLSGLTQEALPNDVKLYASPYQYGGCTISNRDKGIAGYELLTNGKNRIIYDGGLSDCVSLPTVPSNNGGGGGGGGMLKKDNCPNSDFSPSYYDNECEIIISTTNVTSQELEIPGKDNMPSSENIPTEETQSAYEWAYNLGITTLSPLENAAPEGPVLRSHLAKMITNYAIKVVGLQPDFSKVCTFNDVLNETEELQQYMTLACTLGIMGIHQNGTSLSDFMPNKIVSRAEFGTVISRLLYGTTYNDGTPYYIKHLQVLKKNGIMTQIDAPEQRQELRQRVRLMLMRSASF